MGPAVAVREHPVGGHRTLPTAVIAGTNVTRAARPNRKSAAYLHADENALRLTLGGNDSTKRKLPGGAVTRNLGRLVAGSTMRLAIVWTSGQDVINRSLNGE